jgi:GT2 family glycosyltransferase
MYDALNRGFKRAGGDVLGWLNADEQYLDNALDTVRRFLDEHPRADAVFGDYIAIAADGAPIAARREIPLRRWYAVNGTLYVQSCALFFRRRVLDRTGEFDPSFRIAGDKEWILRALDRGARFAHLRAYLALFSVSGSNLSRQPALRAESERVRRLHRALRVPALRLVPRLCRWAEKAARGCLGRRRVSYRFIHPGTLSVRPVSARVGSAWRWSASP